MHAVSFLDLTLKEGKESCELGVNPWACVEEFPSANQISALAQSYCRNATSLYIYLVLRNFHVPIRSQLWHGHITSLPWECNIATAMHLC